MSFSSRTTQGFTGHESDDELGLVNMKGRIYDPEVGRFLTTDPIVSAPLSGQSWNPFSYVSNNPLSYVDPSGFEPDTVPFARVELTYGPNGDPIGLKGILPPPDPPEKKDDGEKVGAYAPPVDVSPTGNTASYEPQPATAAAEDWREDPAAQFRGGMLAGVALGLVPFGGVGEQLLDATGVLPQTSHFRRGAAIGQILGGFALLLAGGTGTVLGGGASATGIGAVLGVPAIAVSAGLIAGGIGNIAAGFGALMTTGSGSASPPAATPAPGGLGRRFHPGRLADHFQRHGADFGAKTAAEYERMADRFLTGQRGAGVLERVRPNGDVVRFNPSTDAFGIISRDGTIRTFYKPDPAVHGLPTNLDYFNAQ